MASVEIRPARCRLRGLDSAWLEATWQGTPTLYVHGVPDDGSMWAPFLARTGGIAPDLPGFGESAKPRDLPYGIDAIADHLEALADHLDLGRVNLVVHDWGAAALSFAQRDPERIARLVILNGLPLLDGYRWHRTARIWRTPLAGELFMLLATKRVARLISRQATAAPGPMPDDWLDRVWSHFDRDTRRAILRLYRNTPENDLASAGRRLAGLRAPALVLWGDRDPYLPSRFADAWGAALPNATVEHVPDASHWCWIDRPDLVSRATAWLAPGPVATRSRS